jgi:hypothetical protein
MSVSLHCALLPGTHSGAGTSVGALVPVIDHGATSSMISLHASPRAAAALNDGSVGAAAIGRAALLRNLPLMLNVSLALGGTIGSDMGDGWLLVSAVLNVLQAGPSFPLLTAAVPFAVLSSDVVGRQQFLAIAISPPNSTSPPRWLPTSLSTFRAVTLELRLVLRCPTNPSIAVGIVVEVPCPGQEQPLTSEVKAAGIAAQYSTLFAGVGVGSAVGRVAAARRLVLCSDGSISNGLLPLSVVACKSTTPDSDADVRGTMVGNLVLWGCASALLVFGVATFAWLTRRSLRHSAEALGMPSPLLPLAVATLSSTAPATLFLYTVGTCATDSVIATIGSVMCIAPIVVLCVVAHYAPRRLVLVGSAATTSLISMRVSCVVAYYRRLCARNVRWVQRRDRDATDSAFRLDEEAGLVAGTGAHHSNNVPQNVGHLGHIRIVADASTTNRPPPHLLDWSRVATVLLLEYAVVWYACIDVVVLLAVSLLSAVATLSSASACRGTLIAVLVLYACQLLLCLTVRPFTTLFSYMYNIFSLALTTVAVACQLWYLYESRNAGVDLEAVSTLLRVAAVCDLCVSGVSLFRTLVDVLEALRACHRHLCAVLTSNRHKRPPQLAQDTHDTEIVVPTRQAQFEMGGRRATTPVDNHRSYSNGTDLLAEFDDMFWNADGTAVGAAELGSFGKITTALEELQHNSQSNHHDTRAGTA